MEQIDYRIREVDMGNPHFYNINIEDDHKLYFPEVLIRFKDESGKLKTHEEWYIFYKKDEVIKMDSKLAAKTIYNFDGFFVLYFTILKEAQEWLTKFMDTHQKEKEKREMDSVLINAAISLEGKIHEVKI